MITVKTKIEFTRTNFLVNYFEDESITDFEYLIILMTNEAISKSKDLGEMIIEFTNGENDVKLLIEKRFRKLFKVDTTEYKSVELQAKEMVKKTKKLVPAKQNFEIDYEPNLGLYFYQNKLIDRWDLEEEIKKPFIEDKNKTLKDIVYSMDSKKRFIELEIDLNGDFKTFSILNVQNSNNDIILENAKSTLIENTKKLIDFDYEDIEIMKKYENEFSQIIRNYGKKSIFSTLVNLDEIWKDSILEFDYSNDGSYVISEFKRYNDIPLVKTNKMSIENFKAEINYDKFIKYFENNFDAFTQNFKEIFFKNINSKIEFEFAKKTNLFIVNKKTAFNKIDKMIEYKINLINDEFIAKNDLVDFYIKSNSEILYKYLEMFYGNKKFDDISNKKVLEILYSVFNKDSSLLSNLDHKMILEIVKDSNFTKEKVNDLINLISSKRASVKSAIEKIEKYINDLNNDEVEEFNFASSSKIELEKFKRICNFIVHIRDKGGNDYSKDEKIVKKYDKKLIYLKQEIDLYENENLIEKSDSNDYIESLSSLETEIDFLINKIGQLK